MIKNTRVVGGLVLPNSCEALYLRQGDALSSTTTPFVSLQLSISSSKSGSSSTPSLGCSSKWRILCCEPAFEILLSLCIRSPNTKFGCLKSHLFAPKITENGRFWVKKNGTSDAQIQKRRPLFVANYPQKWWNRLLFHKNIIFRRVLGKFWKSRILGSFLAYFPL